MKPAARPYPAIRNVDHDPTQWHVHSKENSAEGRTAPFAHPHPLRLVRIPVAWPPVCKVCGQQILSLDTGVMVFSNDMTLPEIERAQFAQHRFCAAEQPEHSLDLRDFADLLRNAGRKSASR